MTQARSSMCVQSGPLSFHQWQNLSFSHSHGVHSRTDYTHSNVELNTVYTVPTVIVLYFAFFKAFWPYGPFNTAALFSEFVQINFLVFSVVTYIAPNHTVSHLKVLYIPR